MSNGYCATRSLRLAVGCALALASSLAAAQQTGDQELEEIVVTGSQIRLPDPFAGGQVAEGGRAGILGNLDNLETPFSTTSYTEELARNQQAKGIADVLLNDPNVRSTRGFGNFQEVYVIRGFAAFSDDMTYNGIFGVLPREFVAAELVERVEVFRGASAFLNGAAPGGSNLGGTINLVPKRAPDAGLTRLTVGYDSTASYNIGLDVGRRFGTDKATGIRANAVYRDGETSVEDQDRNLTVLSFGVDHRGDKLRLAADFGYQDHQIDAPRPSVFPGASIPKPPDADKNFGQPWTFSDEKQLFGVVRAEYDITRAVSVWAAVGMREGDEDNSLGIPFVDAEGTFSPSPFKNAREDSVSSGELGLRWDFATGPVEHRIIVSGTGFSLDSKNAFACCGVAEGSSNLYHPVTVPPADPTFLGGSLSNPKSTEKTDTSSFALADMMTFADGKFILTLGARDQNLKTDTFDFSSGDKTSSYDESEVTPVAGLVFRPNQSMSFYANYIEGLIKGDIAPETGPGDKPVVNGGEAQSPFQSKQIEAGAKYESERFGATLSLFEINKAFGILEPAQEDPDNLLVFRDDGEQRNRGVELSVYGEPIEHVRLIGGVTWLNAELTQTQDGVNEGKDPIGVPDTQANVNVEWDLPGLEGLTLEGRALYTSKQFADLANTLEVDSWTRFDIGARWASEIGGRPFAIRARIANVTNENDWVSVGGYPGANYLVLSDPRTYVLSASFDF